MDGNRLILSSHAVDHEIRRSPGGRFVSAESPVRPAAWFGFVLSISPIDVLILKDLLACNILRGRGAPSADRPHSLCLASILTLDWPRLSRVQFSFFSGISPSATTPRAHFSIISASSMPHANGTMEKVERFGTVYFGYPFQSVSLWKTSALPGPCVEACNFSTSVLGRRCGNFPPLEPAAPIGDPPTQPENR